MTKLEDKLNELKKGYLKKLETVLQEFNALLNESEIDIKLFYAKVHTISGTSGIYGIKELSNYSTDFEIYLKEKINNDIQIEQSELKDKIVEYINFLNKILMGE